MNKVYKVIWSKAKNAYVVVSELTRAYGKSRAVKCIQTSTAMMLLLTVLVGSNYVGIHPVYAAGQGEWGGSADGDGSLVVGQDCKGRGDDTTIYGSIDIANGKQSTIIGHNNQATKTDSSIADADKVTFATIVGANNRVRADEGIAIGDNVQVEGEAAIGIGLYTRAAGAYSIAIGNSTDIHTKDDAVAKALGAYSLAIGTINIAQGEKSIALGYHNYAKQNNGVSIGQGNNAYGENGIAIGVSTSSGCDVDSKVKDTIAIGNNSKATGHQSIALGKESKATGTDAIAIGTNAQASAEQGVAIGMNTKAVANSVALGTNAVATEANTVSVGKTGGTMSKIVNMANATADHDAAAYNQLITNIQYKDGKIAFYKGKEGETATNPAKAAWSFDINGTAAATTITAENKTPQDATYTDGNIQINKTTHHGQNAYDVKLNNHLNLTEQGSLIAGNTKLDTTGLVITDGPKVTKAGIDAGSQVISNVADGKISADSKEAINGSQVYEVEQKVIKNEKDIASIKNGDFIDNTTITNITNKLTDGGEIAKDNARLVTGGTVYKEVRPADGTYVKTENTTGENLTSLDKQTKTNADAIAKHTDDIAKNTDAISKNTDAIAKNADSIASIKNGDFFDNTTITNITNKLTDDGEIAKDNTHLVTGGTIYTEIRPTDGNYVKTNNTTAVNLSALDRQTKDNTDAIASIKAGDFLDKTNIENLAEKLDTGRVEEGNKGLVSGGKVYEAVKEEAAAREKADLALEKSIHDVGRKISSFDKRINKVGAGAAALAALHPMDFDPDDKWDFAAGYGNYRGANAVAVGAYYRPNEDTMVSVGGSFGGGERMLNAGVSVKIGQGNHVSTSRVAMAKEIKAMSQQIKTMSEHMAAQDKLIAQLTAPVNTLTSSQRSENLNMLFPDVPKNHWAYDYVTKLAQAGYLKGYPDGSFQGNAMMTRYEFAAVIYRAMMNGAARDAKLSSDDSLSRLMNEFAAELEHFHIDTIQKDKNGKPTIERIRLTKLVKK